MAELAWMSGYILAVTGFDVCQLLTCIAALPLRQTAHTHVEGMEGRNGDGGEHSFGAYNNRCHLRTPIARMQWGASLKEDRIMMLYIHNKAYYCTVVGLRENISTVKLVSTIRHAPAILHGQLIAA